MLLWQQNMHEFHDLFYQEVRWDIARKAFFCAIFVYALLFLPLIISNAWNNSVVTIVVRTENVPVLFMGTSKTGAGQARTGKKITKSHAEKKESKKIIQQKVVEKKQNIKEQKNKKSAPQKNELKKSSEKISRKPESIKKIISEPKKIETKKIESITKKNPKIEIQKKMEPIQEKIVLELEKKIVTQEKSEPELQKEIEIEEVFVGSVNQICDSQAYDAQTKAHMALSRAIARVWKTSCVKIEKPTHALIEIDAQGKPLHVELEQKSGVPLHDLASRAAALRAEYPREFWGKKIRIIFGD